MVTNQRILLRRWHMLHMIPRAPRKITAQEIRDRLAIVKTSCNARLAPADGSHY